MSSHKDGHSVRSSPLTAYCSVHVQVHIRPRKRNQSVWTRLFAFWILCHPREVIDILLDMLHCRQMTILHRCKYRAIREYWTLVDGCGTVFAFFSG